MNRKYELVYVVSPDASDEQVAELHTQVEGIERVMNTYNPDATAPEVD